MKYTIEEQLRHDALQIALSAIKSVKPEDAVKRALTNIELHGNIYLVAVGKAAWEMANAVVRNLETPICQGIVLTKYHHVLGDIPSVRCLEAGHPVPDENSFRGTQAILDMTANLSPTDTVLFLLSGGGSALFEKPLISTEALQQITEKMLAGGLDIVQMNTIRKRLSAVKGGRFAEWCAPARIEAIILSDILGDPVDMIASGPTAEDPSTCEQAYQIATDYGLILGNKVEQCLRNETPKKLNNVHNQVIGSVKHLCVAAKTAAQNLGYETMLLTDTLSCEASDAGRWLSDVLVQHAYTGKKLAILAGGETVVHLKGNGLGGRNQELALAAAEKISGLPNIALISVGSDGTDGPTDAAGGYVDGTSVQKLSAAGLDYRAMLDNNDAYHALAAIDGLIKTGPTGTNVNDISIGLVIPTCENLHKS